MGHIFFRTALWVIINYLLEFCIMGKWPSCMFDAVLLLCFVGVPVISKLCYMYEGTILQRIVRKMYALEYNFIRKSAIGMCWIS